MQGTSWKSSFHPRWLLITLVVLAGVLTLTHIPNEDIPSVLQSNNLDKIEHIAAYGLITGCFLLSLKRPVRLTSLLLGLAIIAGIGALDETTQPFVHRTASLVDYACDLTGIILACLLFGAVGRLRFRAALR